MQLAKLVRTVRDRNGGSGMVALECVGKERAIPSILLVNCCVAGTCISGWLEEAGTLFTWRVSTSNRGTQRHSGPRRDVEPITRPRRIQLGNTSAKTGLLKCIHAADAPT